MLIAFLNEFLNGDFYGMSFFGDFTTNLFEMDFVNLTSEIV